VEVGRRFGDGRVLAQTFEERRLDLDVEDVSGRAGDLDPVRLARRMKGDRQRPVESLAPPVVLRVGPFDEQAKERQLVRVSGQPLAALILRVGE
jgi:hypothetical protein